MRFVAQLFVTSTIIPLLVDSFCPEFGTLKAFGKEGIKKGRYLGRWYEQEAPAFLYNKGAKCQSYNYKKRRNKSSYELSVTTSYYDTRSAKRHSSTSPIIVEDQKDPNFLRRSSLSYRVIATDYENFAIEYSCLDNGLVKRMESIWILTREKNPPEAILSKAMDALEDLNLSNHGLRPTKQDCKDIELEKSSTISSRKEVRANLIQTGDLVAKMSTSFFSLAQSIFAPWTLPGEPFGLPSRSRRNFRVEKSKKRRKLKEET